MTRQTITTILVLFLGIGAISFGAIFIKFCPQVPAIIISAYRLGIAALILGSIASVRGINLSVLGKTEIYYGLLGGFFLALHFITWISSLKYTSVASSVVLVTTYPIFVGVLAWIFLRERQPKELIFGIFLSILGSGILAVGDSGLYTLAITDRNRLVGDLLALAGALAGSGYLLVGSKLRLKLDIFTYITLVYSCAAVFLIATALLSGLAFSGYGSRSYIFLILLAIVPQLMGHTAFNWALKHLKTSMVAITMMGEPIGASVMAFFFFGEVVSGSQFIGFLFIFAAIYIAAQKGQKSRN